MHKLNKTQLLFFKTYLATIEYSDYTWLLMKSEITNLILISFNFGVHFAIKKEILANYIIWILYLG